MRQRFLASIGGLAVALLMAIPITAQTAKAGQTKAVPGSKSWTPPRTADGQPDLQGVWANNSATPFERPKELAGKESFTDEEVAALKEAAARLHNAGGDAAFGDNFFATAFENAKESKTSKREGTGTYSTVWMVERDFDKRTSLIVDPPDGRLPPLTPEAQKRQAAAAAVRQRLTERPEDLPNLTRCINLSVPQIGGIVGAGYNSYYHILQAPGYVVIATELIHDARIIPLDGRPHLPQSVRQWNGDSRGRWDGNTLVVETTNYSPNSNYHGAAEKLHAIERFTRAAPDTIDYEVTISDPTTWTRPWSAVAHLKQTQETIYEYACHEGNTAMGGILAGARAVEKKAADSRR